jgi:hypothetical protein
MRDVLLLVDVLDDFGHEHGEELLRSLARRHEGLTYLPIGVSTRCWRFGRVRE